MSGLSFNAIPCFRILDYEKAKEFYTGFLCFNIDWEHRFADDQPVYMQVSRDGLKLHLSENKRFNAGSAIYIETKGIKEFRENLAANNTGLNLPPVSVSPWNTVIMEIEDPFGNLLRFNEELIQSNQ